MRLLLILILAGLMEAARSFAPNPTMGSGAAGTALADVFYLRSMTDSEKIRARLVAGSDVVIIGAGWIGLEIAAAARHHGASPMSRRRRFVPVDAGEPMRDRLSRWSACSASRSAPGSRTCTAATG